MPLRERGCSLSLPPPLSGINYLLISQASLSKWWLLISKHPLKGAVGLGGVLSLSLPLSLSGINYLLTSQAGLSKWWLLISKHPLKGAGGWAEKAFNVLDR